MGCSTSLTPRPCLLLTVDRFDLSPGQILEALASPELAIEPVPDVELPHHLVDPQEIEDKVQVRLRHCMCCLYKETLLSVSDA